MYDINYNLYQLVDRHPVILILMLTIIYFWVGGKTREFIAKEIKGDKRAKLKSAFYFTLSMWVVVAVFQIFINHQQSITGSQSTCAYFQGHRYDVGDNYSLTHSPLCGCKQKNSYLPQVPLDSLNVDSTAKDSMATEKVGSDSLTGYTHQTGCPCQKIDNTPRLPNKKWWPTRHFRPRETDIGDGQGE